MTDVMAPPAIAPAGTVDVELTPCQRYGPHPWFSQRPADLEYAKALCQPCPLLRQCLSGAILRREPHGVWGGQIFERGVVIEHKRARGRPRKARPERNPQPCTR